MTTPSSADAIAELERLRAFTRDLIEELDLVRRGVPFHVHVDELAGVKTRCHSPYCVDLTMEGIRDHA